MLFTSLVLNQVSSDGLKCKKASAYDKTPEPLLFFTIVPSAESGVPINISRDKKSYGYWDYPINLVKSNEFEMRFIDFFDFDLLGFRDFQYCRVRIIQSNLNPDLIGHDALLCCNDIRIFFDNTVA